MDRRSGLLRGVPPGDLQAVGRSDARMNGMIDFSLALFQAAVDFLAAEPVIYLFGTVIFCFLCKGIKILMR